jgi:hypothetical protein
MEVYRSFAHFDSDVGQSRIVELELDERGIVLHRLQLLLGGLSVASSSLLVASSSDSAFSLTDPVLGCGSIAEIECDLW